MLLDNQNPQLTSGLADEFLQVINEADLPGMLDVLTEVVVADANMHQPDRQNIGTLMHLITAMIREKQKKPIPFKQIA